MNKACLVKGVNVSRIQSESLKVNLSGPLSLSIFSSVEKPRTCPLDCKSSPKKLFYDVARKEKKKKKKKLVARGSIGRMQLPSREEDKLKKQENLESSILGHVKLGYNHDFHSWLSFIINFFLLLLANLY